MSKIRRVDFSPDEPALGRWFGFDPIYLDGVPAAAGVYVIFIDGVAVYVGQSANIRGRLQQHRFNWGYDGEIKTPWASYESDRKLTGRAKISRRFGDWAMWELRLIRRLRPAFNGTFTSPRGIARRVAP